MYENPYSDPYTRNPYASADPYAKPQAEPSAWDAYTGGVEKMWSAAGTGGANLLRSAGDAVGAAVGGAAAGWALGSAAGGLLMLGAAAIAYYNRQAIARTLSGLL